MGKEKRLSVNDVIFFLNSNNQRGKFDKELCQSLLKFSGLNNSNSITVEDFVQAYIKFDIDLQNTKEKLNNKLLMGQNSLNNLREQCKKFKDEVLNNEGFCEDSKLTLEITGIDIQADLPENRIVQIIIEIFYNGKVYQKFFSTTNDENNANRIFELKPKKKTDSFIIWLKCKDDKNQIIDIGRREFPLNKITIQEECDAIISIPDKNNDNVDIATINVQILFRWSNYQFYFSKMNEEEKKIEKIKKEISETERICKEINDIYLEKKQIQNQQSGVVQNIKKEPIKNEQDQINEINSLQAIIQKLEIENEQLKKENQYLKENSTKFNQIKMQNNKIDINDINKLKQIINEKDNRIKELELILQKTEKKKIYLNDIIVINFLSTDQTIRAGIPCLANDTFAEVEEKLYQTFDEYRNTNNIFLFKGNTILRFKKIKENNIRNGDTVQLVKPE